MKKITSVIMALMTATIGFAQYYSISHIDANSNPGGLNNDTELSGVAGWTIIQGPSATAVWSPVTNIPFSFSFNGSAVTSFKASTTGIVTFTTAASSVPAKTNGTLPDASIPDKSICIWGLWGEGANDNIVTKTFGTAPKRQFWIQYNAYSAAGGGTGSTYWSIVLEESTNHIYVVDHRSANVTLALTIGVQTNSTTATSIAGSPNLNSQTLTTESVPEDNTYYQFIAGTQQANDLNLSKTNLGTGAKAAWGAVGAGTNITGMVQNHGSSTVTNFTVKYNDGTTTTSTNFTGLNIPTNGTYNFTCTPYTVGAVDNTYALKVWVELTGDTNNKNDTLSGEIKGCSFIPNHKIVMEEGTGTWCGWCPRGAVFMDSIYHAYPSKVIPIAVHNNDPMEDIAYDAGIGALISGYPTALADRKTSEDPKNLFTMYNKYINDFGVADLTLTPSFDAITRVATVNVDAKVAISMSNNNSTNDYRLAVVFTEDDVKGTSTAYAQSNYYSGGSTPLSGAGHNWQLAPSKVPAADMEYDFVGRTIVGGFTGLANSLPSTLVAGSTYSKSFTYTVPTGHNVTKMKAIALLINAKTKAISNGNISSSYLDTYTGIEETAATKNNLEVYPQPAADFVTINTKSNNAIIEIYNVFGQKVYSEISQNNSTTVNISGLTKGVYFVRSTADGVSSSTKLIKK